MSLQMVQGRIDYSSVSHDDYNYSDDDGNDDDDANTTSRSATPPQLFDGENYAFCALKPNGGAFCSVHTSDCSARRNCA